MTTFSEATLALAQAIANVAGGTAIGGKATTVVDTARLEVDDHFTGGTIWMTSGNNAGKSRKITSWDLATFTFTFPTMTQTNAASNLYFACGPEFPKEQLERAINQAYTTAYKVPLLYTDPAYITVADQESYALPADTFDVRRVEVAHSTDSDIEWVPHFNWREYNGAIYFLPPYIPSEDDLPIRLTYTGRPDALDGDTDTLHDLIHLDRLKWEAAVHLLTWRKGLLGDDAPRTVTDMLNYALAQAEAMRARYPVPEAPRDPIYSSW